MLAHEFKEWWRDFSRRFPSTASWVADNGGKALLATWQATLAEVTFGDALAASEAMSEGSADKPAAFAREDLPAFVLRAVSGYRIARRAQEAIGTIHSQPTVSCVKCLDAGRVTVWHPMAMQQVRDGKKLQRRICQCACDDCEEGKFWSTPKLMRCGRNTKNLPRFNDQYMVRFDEHRPFQDNAEMLADFIDNPPPRGDVEFHAWNECDEF